jgi:hypothetical protein
MAKGQQTSNREAKKPKQVKPKAAAPASDLAARLKGSQEKSKSGEK